MRPDKTDPKAAQAVEEAAYHRVRSPTDKELMHQFPTLSRSTIYRIMKAARDRIRQETKQLSQSAK